MRRPTTVAVSILAWAVAASASACSGPYSMTTSASTPSQAVPQDAVGLWRISIAGDARGCLLALNLNAANGGYGLLLEDCRLPELSKARSWRMTPSGLELRDERGAVLARLRHQTVDAYKAEGGGPAYLMARAPLT
ncbi:MULTISPECIES: AprI/Inh family metalloprotease inhibitor [unclassified Brevundimonas]|uniref:AprI/Inh family metalloprotease inhibitor n=1 Tax=unclassified Brevundimonas TaxID=2622653 RepID=UPI0025BC7E27|nr:MULTISPECIES: AprI/Inh family metalloprotease inhibitor [unclassified Brevundimonas]